MRERAFQLFRKYNSVSSVAQSWLAGAGPSTRTSMIFAAFPRGLVIFLPVTGSKSGLMYKTSGDSSSLGPLVNQTF